MATNSPAFRLAMASSLAGAAFIALMLAPAPLGPNLQLALGGWDAAIPASIASVIVVIAGWLRWPIALMWFDGFMAVYAGDGLWRLLRRPAESAAGFGPPLSDDSGLSIVVLIVAVVAYLIGVAAVNRARNSKPSAGNL